MNNSRPPGRWRSVAALVTSAAALVAATTVVAPTGAASAQSHRARVDSQVLASVQSGKPATFFVVLDDRADLTTARRAGAHAARANAAYRSLRSTAATSQASLKAALDKKRVGYRSFWIANALLITTDDQQLVDDIAARPDVESIVAERHYQLDDTETPTAQQGTAVATAATAVTAAVTAASVADAVTPEWGVADIKADQVWSQYADTGEGIVIANVDSGVQYNHPALVGRYRGNLGGGAFDNDYNWYDPTGQCASLGGFPCDNNGHGTHTMGTMVGQGGVGVAPGATWIAAKGCEGSSCSDAALLASGQWILAPTDHTGQNPRPDLAPNIVNNSWGGGDTTFYQDVVEAWNSAGIFEAFAAGNDGNGVTCSTAHAPGTQATSYGVGAYDAAGAIANFSGFGPSLVDGSMKPNISAPGVSIRSTWTNSSYRNLNGTSMATPHVAGAVALLWAEAPSLIGDIAETRALLDAGARNVDDTHCGGTADVNNVWGHGKLDILAAVDAAPHTAAVITGSVTDQTTGAALGAMMIRAEGGASSRTVTTSADGRYRLTLPAGSYTFTVSGYGYADRVVSGYEVSAGTDASQDFTAAPVPSHAVAGTVLDVTGRPLGNATVTVAGTPVPAVTTDGAGRFVLPRVAEGTFTLTATPTAPVLCNGQYAGSLTVDADETTTLALPNRTDLAGNSCAPVAYSWVRGSAKTGLSGDEDAKTVALPFPVSFYGVSYTSASITTNGVVNFLQPRVGDYANTTLPTASQPNGTLAAFWDDLIVDKKASVQTATTGVVGSRRFAVVWNDVAFADAPSTRISFEAVFDEASGAITLQYDGVGSSALQRGASATVGMENQSGTDALQYSFNESVLSNGTAIRLSRKAS